jgi:hypothetical protein
MRIYFPALFLLAALFIGTAALITSGQSDKPAPRVLVYDGTTKKWIQLDVKDGTKIFVIGPGGPSAAVHYDDNTDSGGDSQVLLAPVEILDPPDDNQPDTPAAPAPVEDSEKLMRAGL